MHKHTFLGTLPGFRSVVTLRSWQRASAGDLPAVPVLPETLLLLELEAQESAVDLRRFSQIILRDLGATIQILRLAGKNWGRSEVPLRIEDCISDLGVQACLAAMTVRDASARRCQDLYANLWAHSVEVARYAVLISEEMHEVNPDQAYLVGLLHAIGSLPQALGWDDVFSAAENPLMTAFDLANHWGFPGFVQESFHALHPADRTIPWQEIIRAAHQLVEWSGVGCSFEQEPHRLHMAVQNVFQMHGISASASN